MGWRVRVVYPTFSVDYFFWDSNHNDVVGIWGDPGHNICSQAHNGDGASCGEEGPTNLWDCPGWFSRLMEAQKPWLDAALDASTAHWQIVVTHFPPTWDRAMWEDLSRRHGIDLIVTGHTHYQEFHNRDVFNFLHPTAWIITGGGGGITSESC